MRTYQSQRKFPRKQRFVDLPAAFAELAPGALPAIGGGEALRVANLGTRAAQTGWTPSQVLQNPLQGVAVRAPVGSASKVSYGFRKGWSGTVEPTVEKTGMYMPASNEVGFAADGAKRGTFGTTGLTVEQDVFWKSGTSFTGQMAHANSANRVYTFQNADGTVAFTSDIPTGEALTKTDDTNVTVTLGGDHATALVNAASITMGWTGQLGLARGGTNVDLSATGGASQVLKQTTVGGNVTVGQLTLADLSDIALTLAATGDYLRFDGTDWVDVTVSQILTDLLGVDGTGTGLDADLLDGSHASAFQPVDATLTALAGLTIAADSLTVGTGADAFSQTAFAANTFPAKASTGNLEAKTVTDFALQILDDAADSNVRTTLGLGALAVEDTVGSTLIDDEAVTLAKLEHAEANTILLRNAGTTGDPDYVKVSGLTEETAPASGDFMLMEESGGNLRKVDVSEFSLPGHTHASTDVTDFAEAVDDRVDALIQDGTGIGWTYNDGANTLTPAVTLAPFDTADLAEGTSLYYTDERVDDRVAALLVEGTGITLTYDDGANTLTIDADAAGTLPGCLASMVPESISKLNIGTSYVDIYDAAQGRFVEEFSVIDWTDVTEVRVVFSWTYAGAGTQRVRWVDAASDANVLWESGTFTATQSGVDSGWIALPAAFTTTQAIQMQGKSTTANDDPTANGYAIYVR